MESLTAAKRHFNPAQLRALTIAAQDTVVIAGRATGKTEGMIAPWIYNNIRQMPRSTGGVASVTYSALVGKILPGVFKFWEEGLGLKQGKHFWYNTFPDFEKLRIPRPIRMPLEPKHFITFCNGSGTYLLSMDRTLNNGVNLDYFCLDEARFAKQEKVKETILAVRGNLEHFGHLSCHHSKLLVTDRPQTEESRWLLDLKDAMDEETVQVILAVQARIFHLKIKYAKKPAAALLKQIASYRQHLNELRKGLLFYLEASTLDNIHALGVDTIRRFKRDLKPHEYRMSVLNEDVQQVENGFYGLLNEEEHGYYNSNYSYIDTLDITAGTERDCRWDGDILPGEPLEIGFDHNAAINCVVTGQDQQGHQRFLSSLYVENPLRLKDLLANWHEYYQHHPAKTVVYHYDHTCVGTNASSTESFADEVYRELTAKGWHVIRNYFGQAGRHVDRYRLWEKILKGDDTRLDQFSFNRENCEPWLRSCQNTKFVVKGERAYEKDKSKEKRPELYDQVLAPHLSDAGDTLLWGTQARKLQSQNEYISSIIL